MGLFTRLPERMLWYAPPLKNRSWLNLEASSLSGEIAKGVRAGSGAKSPPWATSTLVLANRKGSTRKYDPEVLTF
jgi:hypothetical protein